MATEPLTGARIPDLSYAPDISQLGLAVRDLADNTIPRFASPAARDAAFANWVSQGNTMVDGLYSYTTNDHRLWRYTGSAWLYAGGAPPPIAALNIQAGWPAASNFAPGCYRDASGLISVIGGVTNNSSYSPAGFVIASLPPGYYPVRDIAVTIMLPTGTGFLLGGVYAADGAIKVNAPTGTTVPANTVHTINFSFHPGFTGGALA